MVESKEYEKAIPGIMDWEYLWDKLLQGKVPHPYARYASALQCCCYKEMYWTKGNVPEIARQTLMEYALPTDEDKQHPFDRQVVQYLQTLSENQNPILPKPSWTLTQQSPPPEAVAMSRNIT